MECFSIISAHQRISKSTTRFSTSKCFWANFCLRISVYQRFSKTCFHPVNGSPLAQMISLHQLIGVDDTSLPIAIYWDALRNVLTRISTSIWTNNIWNGIFDLLIHWNADMRKCWKSPKTYGLLIVNFKNLRYWVHPIFKIHYIFTFNIIKGIKFERTEKDWKRHEGQTTQKCSKIKSNTCQHFSLALKT